MQSGTASVKELATCNLDRMDVFLLITFQYAVIIDSS